MEFNRGTRNPSLRRSYDADVDRRNAMTPDEWRLTTVDTWLATVDRGLRLIEIGAGTGQLAEHVARQGYDVTAIDLSSGNVAAMKARGVNAVEADVADLPYSDATFDGGFAFNSLLHVPRDELPDAYREIRRVLRVGSPLLVVVWGGEDSSGIWEDDWLEPKRYFNFFTDAGLWDQETPGFEKLVLTFVETAVVRNNLRSQVLHLVAT